MSDRRLRDPNARRIDVDITPKWYSGADSSDVAHAIEIFLDKNACEIFELKLTRHKIIAQLEEGKAGDEVACQVLRQALADLKPERPASDIRIENMKLREALIWCSGSADFGPGGKAHEGWMKGVEPLLRRTNG